MKIHEIAYEDIFALRLARLRSQNGVSARDMSLSIGQNPNYINLIENGRALPSMTVFFYICEYLNITPSEFFDLDSSQPEALRELVEKLKRLPPEYLQHIEGHRGRAGEKIGSANIMQGRRTAVPASFS